MTSVLTFAKIALRNLFSKPATAGYPFVPTEYPEGSRGHIENDMDECILCGSCARHCPTGCITVDRASKTWSVARFDCVQCQNCVNNCPKKCLTIVPGYFTPGTEKVTESFIKPDTPSKPKPAPKAEETAAPAAAAAPKAEAAAPAADPKAHCDADKCMMCGACADTCPNGAITVADGAWKLNTEACIGCGACASGCPAEAITIG